MSSPTPTPLSTAIAMEAAREIQDALHFCADNGVPEERIQAIIQKHFQPLLAKVEGEAAPNAPKMPFPFHVKADEPHLRVHPAVNTGNQDRELGQWSVKIYNGLVCVVAVAHGQTKKAAEERANKIVYAMQHVHELTALRADLAAKEAVLEAITRRVPIMASTGDYREGQLHALEACRDVARSALASRADKGGAR